MFRLVYVDDPSFTDDNWRQYYKLLEELHSLYESSFAKSSWEDTKRRFLELATREIDPSHRFVVLEDDELTGWASFSAHNLGTPEQGGHFVFDALYEEIPSEVANLMAGETLAMMNQYQVDHAHCMTSTQRESVLPRMWGANELNKVDRFRIYRKDTNLATINGWLEELPKANPNLRLEFYESIPDEYLERYCDLFTLFIREMPTEKDQSSPYRLYPDRVRRDEEWMRSNGRHQYTFALINEQDEMIAHSNSYINGNDPEDVYQAMTGVVKKYRGRGLSKWLKASMFLKVGEDFPDNKFMTTDMRAANAPIQSVNSQMGFVHFSQGNEFEIAVEALREYLEGRGVNKPVGKEVD